MLDLATLPRTPNNLLPHEDKIWRLNNLYKIRSKTGVRTFNLNPLQIKILEDIRGMRPIRHITLKPRQIGVSTLWILYYLDDTLFRQGVISGIMAHEMDSLQHLSAVVKFALDNLPSKVRVTEDNKTRISFAHNASTILIDLEFRSTPLHNLHISEWAFCEDMRIWATLGAVSKWTNITGETTGNGMGNDLYATYMDALEGKNEYKSRFFPWFAHKEYGLTMDGLRPYQPDKRERQFGLTQEQIHFRRQMMAKLKNGFFREFPETVEDAFSESGAVFFDNRKIILLAKEARDLDQNEQYKPFEETDLYKIWERPQKGHKYALGADPAEGLHQDYSCFKVICVTCNQEAMAYRGHVGLDKFYKDLNLWGRKYMNALLGVERNNHGHAILLGLSEDCHYPNLYKEQKEERIIMKSERIRPEPKLGWLTNAQTKGLMCDQLKIAIEGDSEEDENNFESDILIRDLWLLSECLTFQRNGSKLEAAQGKTDDMVIASAIAFQMALKLRSRLGNSLDKVILGGQRQYSLK